MGYITLANVPVGVGILELWYCRVGYINVVSLSAVRNKYQLGYIHIGKGIPK